MNVRTKTGASRIGVKQGEFTFTRTGNFGHSLTIDYVLRGTAVSGVDYQSTLPVTIPARETNATLRIVPLPAAIPVWHKTLTVSLATNANYTVGNSAEADMPLAGNVVPSHLQVSNNTPRITWDSGSNQRYRVVYKNTFADPNWTTLSEINGSDRSITWIARPPRT